MTFEELIHRVNEDEGIPFMITQEMKARLRAAGYKDAQIGRMTPAQANAVMPRTAAPPVAPTAPTAPTAPPTPPAAPTAPVAPVAAPPPAAPAVAHSVSPQTPAQQPTLARSVVDQIFVALAQMLLASGQASVR